MSQALFVGVDGGATKTVVRIEDEAGHLLAQAVSGPANIRLSVEKTWTSIHAALQQALQSLSISLTDTRYQFHVGMGLAGCEVVEAYQAFIQTPHPFTTLIVASDAHTACLGAHGGQDGAIIIAGTGTVGFQIQQANVTKVGGFGFPHDDVGGGAWIGLEAVKMTLQCLDGRLLSSALADHVYAQFDRNLDSFIHWLNVANSTAFAELAPLVIQQAQASDVQAVHILQGAANAIDSIAAALYAKQVGVTPLPCALIGGIAPFLLPYLSVALSSRLQPAQLSPAAGAILLVRHHLKDVS